MPKPIPPPPPQPTQEQTHQAVRLVWGVMAIAIVLFGLLSTRYQYDAWMVSYGRDDGQSWMLWKARTLDEDALRAHSGGRVAWFIGNSVMRDSFDEDKLNERLAADRSPWRVAKFAVTRGAAGLGAGMLDELPIQSGDRIVIPVALDNFYADWLHKVDFPSDRVARMLSPAQMLSIAEYSWQEKLEYATGLPYNFYRHQEPYMAGQARWFTALWWMQAPKKARAASAFQPRRISEAAWLENQREQSWESRDPITPDMLDWGPSQFHAVGIQRFRNFAEQHQVELKLIDIPFRQEYMVLLVDPAAREQWDQWRAAQPELSYFPQLPEEDYYDLRHPNRKGRARMTNYLVSWMDDTPRGEPAPLTWTPESR